MTIHILLASWDDSTKAYDYFTKLTNSSIGNINQASIVERLSDGKIKIHDENNSSDGINTLSGGALGSLLGILGGPLGVLLGFSTDALVGTLFDADDFDETDDKAADTYFKDAHAVVYRWDYDEVEAEIEASVEAIKKANRQANKVLKEQKKEENKVKRQEKWAAFKAKLPHKKSAS
ncbi:hypothetical protein [Acinetobacter sp. ANC 3832]|uniref:hypothetical protein n=1 Tax=Acinetobacter sp. ANC 3832 TaxID=1977874 RepID=UPI000A341BE0|nr:hypothetical protein [Acinetobacter sp. ANC 3832]OTG94932.1 hypothetical protein B9T35_06100 [Acinetobacter sp. ANC 3832]